MEHGSRVATTAVRVQVRRAASGCVITERTSVGRLPCLSGEYLAPRDPTAARKKGIMTREVTTRAANPYCATACQPDGRRTDLLGFEGFKSAT